MSLAPVQEWWTTEQIAACGLPDMPATQRGVAALAEREHWRAHPEHARRRAGKGGGWEYAWHLFPERARRKLMAEGRAPKAVARPGRDEAWAWFEAVPQAVKDRAAARLRIVQQVEALEIVQGRGRHQAVEDVAGLTGHGARTIRSWFAAIEGIRVDDRLPYLAPRNRAQAERPRSKEYEPKFLELIASLYLRPAKPTFSDCYRDALVVARKNGWDTLPERTMRRLLSKTVSRTTQVGGREGAEALMRLYPAQARDKSALHAMEVVNADFHTFDVFVQWPDLPGQNEPNPPCRPHMVAFQDVYSGMIVAWRIDQASSSHAVQLAAGDMIEDYGIPAHVLFDNGREFAAKAITGGAPTRLRFKVKEDDIPGLFTNLGCEIHWASPYHGQAKPIERAFRDMAQSIARDVRFDGAYTGNKPTAKPEDYGRRAVPLETFMAVLAERIAEHNTRQNRRSPVAYKRSFAEVFAESYATAPIRKATAAQRRLWLLGSDGQRADSKTGAINFQGNRYWADWMLDIARQRVIIRFDLADFRAGLHVYSQDGAYLGHAPIIDAVGFLDQAEASTHARAKSAFKAAQRQLLKAARKYSAAQAGALLDDAAGAPAGGAALLDAKVVKPIFGKAPGRSAGAAEPAAVRLGSDLSADAARFQSEMVVDLQSRRPEPVAEPDGRADFRHALAVERRIEAGLPVTPEEALWLRGFQGTAVYRGERLLWEEFGDEMFA